MRSLREGIAVLVLLAAPAGCAHTAPFTWVDALPPGEVASAPDAYVIAPGDVLNIQVLNQPAMSSRSRVRDDGKISLPFLRDVEVAGLTPQVVGEQLQTRLKDFVTNPVVTVSVDEPQAISVSVIGEVSKPGIYPLDRGAGVLTALAAAGGLSDFADRAKVFVLRKNSGDMERIRFRYDELLHGDGKSGSFALRRGDVVVVE